MIKKTIHKRGRPIKDGDITRVKILEFVSDFIAKRGYSPSIREIRDGIGFSSTNSVAVQLRVMRDMGMIDMQDGTARSVRPKYSR